MRIALALRRPDPWDRIEPRKMLAYGFENGLQLCVWWAIWTLFDNYLIVFSPWSELTMLFVCATAAAAPRAVTWAREAIARHRAKMHRALQGI